MAMALFPFRNPITDATGCFGGIAMHMCTWSGIRVTFDDLALLLPGQRVEDRTQLPTRLAEDGLPASFGHEHHMVLAVPFRMG